MSDTSEVSPNLADTRRKWVCKNVDGKLELVPIEQYVAPVSANYYVIPDTIPDTWHPVSGGFCNSRSEMARIGKAEGLECIGNEKIKTKKYAPSERERTENRERLAHAYDTATRSNR